MANALYLLLLLILPISALAARRLPFKQVARMGLAWIAIFAIALVAVGVLSGTHLFDHGPKAEGSTVKIAMAADGHFWVQATINGVPRHMLIDSGATTTALSRATAKAADIDTNASPFATLIETANGSIAANRATVSTLSVGSITTNDLPVLVADAFGDTDILGMNFLSRLKGWSVEGRTLTLNP